MATTTTKLALTKPATSDVVDIAVLNANADKLDTAAGAFMCTSTTRPTTPWNGQVIFETNTLNQYVWVAATSTWARLGGTPSATVTGLASETVPTGWLKCDGSSYLVSAYPELAAAINYKFGGSGTNFNVPDLRGRAPVGVDGGANRVTSNNALGQGAGAESVTLSVGQLPAHNHTGTTSTNGLHNHRMGFAGGSGGEAGYAGGTIWNRWSATTEGNGDHNHTFTTNNTGSGEAHNNLQPYLVLNYVIKV